jgi:major type 1 subunit fimbrin (pilin)
MFKKNSGIQKNVITAAAATLFVCLAPGMAAASDGTVNITGLVTASTCKINTATSPVTIAVALPTVSTSALPSAGTTAGRTPFTIALSNCTAALSKAQTYFEPGPTVDTATNNLILQGAGSAANVELQLLNADSSKILLGNAIASQNTATAAITGGAATLNYFAQYYATGVAGAGTANSSVTFTMVYQ